ncbi:HIT family protein [Magnetofaba australis]|uniref:Putative HIT family hydrolase n=1 Tax=Magnetofaba australis IT-1 TaxID=1434232 RepID=A0A1Y2K006_9PROT|nr:HIT family protein [Magnetofaba australis]OSM01358.1 putative HIT family hydrolase [Magnetofaba australis IT-1]
MTASFELHSRLQEDCALVGDLPCCRVLLARDARYPWVILVPRVEGARDLDELSAEEGLAVHGEMIQVSRAVKSLFQPTKLNVGVLGNIVPQLHIHVIARFAGDDAWPGPIWGAHPPLSYPPEQLSARAQELAQALGLMINA